MEFLLGALVLISFAVMVFGSVIGVFARGRRKSGWILAGGGGIGAVASSIVLATFVEVGESETTKERGQPSPSAIETELEASYLTAFCAFEENVRELSHEREARFSENDPAGQIWIDGRVEELRARLNQNLGLEGFALDRMAMDGFWGKRCRAASKSWTTVGLEEAHNATRRIARTASRTLQAQYVMAFRTGKSHYFRISYNAAACGSRSYEQLHYVGCWLEGPNLARSNIDLFLVGISADGVITLSPMNGGAVDRSNSFDTTITASAQESVSFAELLAPPTTISDVISAF